MKRLLILRHAKAGPHDEKHDKQRPLIERGRDDAALMGRAMRERRYLPDLVLCSSAKRTVETWQNLAPMLGMDPQIQFLDALYDAPETSLLKSLRAAKGDASTLLYIGHNPGLEEFARTLAGKPAADTEGHWHKGMMEKFPTCALAVVDFNIGGWAEIAAATGVLADFLTPADLKKK